MSVTRITVLLAWLIVLSMLVIYGLAESRLGRTEVQQGKYRVAKSSSGNCGGHFDEVQKCMGDIMDDVMRAQFAYIGQTCCRVMAEIGQDCNYIKILPFDPLKDPFWGPLITDYCTAKP